MRLNEIGAFAEGDVVLEEGGGVFGDGDVVFDGVPYKYGILL